MEAAPAGDPLRASVSLGTQEVRLATTMTGGVSLAIWMGGVARELDLLRRASQARLAAARVAPPDDTPPADPAPADPAPDATGPDPAPPLPPDVQRYKDLLDILDVVVEPDIYSGTSAGGINAVMLAYARANGGDLGSVKDMWLDLGDLGQLLRNPTDADVPSLLYGDEHMYAKLVEKLPDITRARSETPDPATSGLRPPTTLYVTTTLLTGESSRFTDSLGTQVQDTEHRGLFTFTDDHLRGDASVSALALAARSTASFPGAFEPSFVPFDTKTPATRTVPERPPMRGIANITRSHWVADGGLLDNQPIDVLLQRVFETPADRRVRRVLLYVVPSTGPATDVWSQPGTDDPDDPPGLVGGLLKDLAAATSQSISGDLRSVMDHNGRVRARGRLRVHLAELGSTLREGTPGAPPPGTGTQAPGTPGAGRVLTAALRHDYVTARSDLQAGKLVARWLERLTTAPAGTLPKTWHDLLSLGGSAEHVARSTVADAIAAAWTRPGAPALPTRAEDLGAYGRAAYDDAMSVALTILQRAYDAVTDAAATTTRAADAGTADPLDARDTLTRLSGALHANLPAPADATRDSVQDLRGLSPRDAVERSVADVLDASTPDLAQAALALAQGWVRRTVGSGLDDAEPGYVVTADHWRGLGSVLLDAARALPDPVRDTPPERDEGAGGLDELATFLHYLGLGGGDPAGATAELVALRLFDLVLAERALLPEDVGPYQSVELVQVSADTRSLIASDQQASAQDKLTGMQFHHFGAFYKRSWRANDWMWGRLDGAGWLVHTLLDPRRLRTRVALAYPGDAAPRERFLTALATAFGLSVPPRPAGAAEPADHAAWASGRTTDVWGELAFLDHPDWSVEDRDRLVVHGLPRTALWLAQAWQRPVAATELWDLAHTVLGEGDLTVAPDVSPAQTLTWAKQVTAFAGPAALLADPRSVTDLLARCPVSRETFASDRGTPLMVRTLTKAAATATGAVRSVRELPGPVAPAVTTARTVALGGYRVATSVKGVAARVILLGLVLLVLGIALASTSASFFGFTGGLVAVVGGYLVTLGVWQKAGLRTVAAVLSITVVAAVGLLATPSVRRWLFGTSTTDLGKTAAAVHWLGDQWWHPLLAVGVLVLVASVLLAAWSAAWSRRSTPRPARARARSAARAEGRAARDSTPR